MRFLKNIFAFAAVAALVLSCSGTSDDSTLPVLKASASEIDLADEASVTFTVTFNGQDVTSVSEIYTGNTKIGNVFIAEEVGTYSFYAVYDGKRSAEVSVNVLDNRVMADSKYQKHVSLIEFTGAWCSNCPSGYEEMALRLSKYSMKKYRDYIHLCAFHSNMEGTDDLAVPQTQDVFKLFKGLGGYPAFATDLREAGTLAADGQLHRLEPSLVASFEEYPAHCGVAVTSTMNSDKTKAEVTVKVASELTSIYRVVVLVVEDNIVGPQLDGDYTDPNYNHRHVVRKVVTSYTGTFTGERITDDGKIVAGKEASKDWEIDVDNVWKLDDTEIYALVLDSKGHVNNMNVCAVDGGSAGYNLKK